MGIAILVTAAFGLALYGSGVSWPALLLVCLIQCGAWLVLPLTADTSRLSLKESTEALRQNSEDQHRFRVIFEHAATGMAFIDYRSEKIIECNAAYASMLGYTPAELRGKPLDLISHPGDHHAIKQHWPELMSGLVPRLRQEKRYRHRDGHEVWGHLTCSVIRDAAGELLYLVGVVEDITERKLSEDRLEFFRLLIGQTQDPVYVTCPAEGFRFVYVNRAACEHYRTSEEKLLTWSVPEFDPNFSPEVCARFWTDLKARRTIVFETLHRRADGEIIPVEVSSNYIRHGSKEYVAGYIRDISLRKQLEAERARLSTAIEQSPDMVVVTDINGIIEYVNPAFERITGYTRIDAIKRTPRLVKSGRQEREFYNGIWDTVLRGAVWKGRLVNRRKDGSLFDVEETIAPVRDAEGRISGFVSIARDVTEQLQNERRLREIQKVETIGTLAGGIAHDLNNILTPVMGYADLAQRRLAGNEPVRRLLEPIGKASRRAADLVTQLLTVSRRKEAPRQPVDPAVVVSEALRLLRATLPAHIEIVSRIEPDAGQVMGDTTQIHQVVMNLCTNAFHAMRSTGGRLDVALEHVVAGNDECRQVPGLAPGTYVRLAVADTGHGIGPAVLERIFEPYFTTKPVGEGSGLGLAVVHGIVTASGGAIGVQSTEGRGTRFEVFLPRLATTGVAAAMEDDCTPSGGQGRVLVVDDELAIAEVFVGMLESIGYSAVACASPTQALDLIRDPREHVDLLLTDLTMPRMLGTDLALNARALRPDIPVVLITGLHDFLGTDRLTASGIRRVLRKPIGLGELGQAVREVLAARSSELVR